MLLIQQRSSFHWKPVRPLIGRPLTPSCHVHRIYLRTFHRFSQGLDGIRTHPLYIRMRVRMFTHIGIILPRKVFCLSLRLFYISSSIGQVLREFSLVQEKPRSYSLTSIIIQLRAHFNVSSISRSFSKCSRATSSSCPITFHITISPRHTPRAPRRSSIPPTRRSIQTLHR